MIDVTMPQLGESVDSGTISRWFKAAGDTVAIDEPLLEVSSDKVTMEIPSLAAGRLSEIIVREGDEVPVGSIVARIADTEEYASSVAASNSGHREATAGTTKRAGRNAFSPVVRRLACEHKIDLARITGSARNERVTKRDVLAYVASATPTPPAPTPTLPPAQPTGPALPEEHRTSDGRRETFSPARRTAIARLSAAQKNAVNVFSVIEIDMERVSDVRKMRRLTYLPFIARAVVDALRACPSLNASLDENEPALIHHEAVHLGIAVNHDEHVLVVPVVRNAQDLTVDALAREIARLADAARARRLGPDAYAGATFAITNNGVFGSLMTAPVINAPNVAIVSTDAVEERPVVINRMIAIRRRMYFCMTWDHRAFDGSTASRFLQHVKHALETWDWSIQ